MNRVEKKYPVFNSLPENYYISGDITFGLNYTLTDELLLSKLSGSVVKQPENIMGIFPIISTNGKFTVSESDFTESKHIFLGTHSNVVLTENNLPVSFTQNGTNYGIYADVNTHIFVDYKPAAEIPVWKTFKSHLNNIFNFPHLTAGNLQPLEKNNWIFTDTATDWKSFTVGNDILDLFHTSLGPYTSEDSIILAPKLLNNGDVMFWGQNKTQYVLNDINIEVIPSSENSSFVKSKIRIVVDQLQALLDSLPYDLNGHTLYINLSRVSTAATVHIKNFFGGTIILERGTISKLSVTNCDNINIKDITFTGNQTLLELTNAQNTNIENCIFNYMNYQKAFSFDNSTCSIIGGQMKFSSSYSSAFKGVAKNNSKVFIDESVVVKFGDKELETFAKFEIADTSMVTWTTPGVLPEKVAIYAETEFKGITPGLASSVYIGNHMHQNIPADYLPPDFGGIGGDNTGGDTGSGSGDGGDTNPLGLVTNNILPVGSIFYWPRAFKVPVSSTLYTYVTSDAQQLNGQFQLEVPSLASGSLYQKSSVSSLIPFVSGAIPLDGCGTTAWSNRWSTELTKLASNTNSTVSDFAQLYTLNTSAKNSVLFNFKSDANPNNTILSAVTLNWNTVGPSIRQERADSFGCIALYHRKITEDGVTFNRPGISIQAGATHNWGGQNHTPYKIMTTLNSKGKNPYEIFKKAKTDNNARKLIAENLGKQNGELPPPHNEFWLCRQGFHMVYKVALDQDILPEYLQHGFLKFQYEFKKPTFVGADIAQNWFGTFMIADDYNWVTNFQFTEASASGPKYPKYKNYSYISYNKNAGTIFTYNGNYYTQNELVNQKSSFAYKPVYYDPKDVPLYGNYYIQGNGSFMLPLNKIAGKYLIFGTRGTYSDTKTEPDNGRYTGKYRGSVENSTNTCNFNIYNFQLLPTVYPYLKQEGEDPENVIWKLANTSTVELTHNLPNDNDKKIILGNNDEEIYYQKDLGAFGVRYYTNKTCEERNTTNKFWSCADFNLDEIVVSDTVMCIKSQPETKIIDLLMNVPVNTLIDDSTYYWFLEKPPTVASTVNQSLHNTSGSVINVSNGVNGGQKFEAINDYVQKKYITDIENPQNLSIYNDSKPIYYFKASENGGIFLAGPNSATLGNMNSVILGSTIMSVSGPGKSGADSHDYEIHDLYHVKQIQSFSATSFIKALNDLKLNINHTGLSEHNGKEYNFFGIHFGLSCLNLLKKCLSAIKSHLGRMNGTPTYFYSPYSYIGESEVPGQFAQQIKYTMGYIGDTTIKDHDTRSTGWEQIKATALEVNDIPQNNVLGIVAGHESIRKTVGFSWPMIQFDDNAAFNVSSYIDGKIPDDLNTVQSFVDRYGFFRIDDLTNLKNMETLSNVLPNSLHDVVFKKKPKQGLLSVWNIPYIWSPEETSVAPLTFSYGTGSGTGTNIADIWTTITLPNAVSNAYPQIKDKETFFEDPFGKILNTEKLWAEYIKVFKSNPNNKLKLTATTAFRLNSDNSLMIHGFLVGDKNNLNMNSVFTPAVDENGITENATPLGKDVLLSQNEATRNSILNSGHFAIVTQYGDSDMLKDGCTFAQLRTAVGSLTHVFPYSPQRIVTVIDNSELQITYQYTFQNPADVLLFCLFYKSTINHYFCKLNLLFKGLKFWKNTSGTNVLGLAFDERNATMISFNDMFPTGNNIPPSYGKINSPSDLINGYNYAILASVNDVLNYDIIWRGFPTVNADDKFNDSDGYCKDIVHGYQTWNWIDFSKDAGNSNYNLITALSGIPKGLSESTLKPDVELYPLTTATQTACKNINDISKKMISIYRPYFIEYSDMYKIRNFDPMSLYTVRHGSFKTYTSDGLYPGIFAFSRIDIGSNGCVKNAYMLNWNMLNHDWGWGKAGYTIDSILNANVSFDGLK